MLFSGHSFSQIKKSFDDSALLKKEIDSVLRKHGLKSKGFSINVISLDQKGGQTAYAITNNYYGNVTINKEKELTTQDETDILRKIDSVKGKINITSNDIMFFKSQYSNAPKFASELRSFLVNKGYNLDRYIGSNYPAYQKDYSVGFIDAPENRGYCIIIVVGQF